MRRVVIRQPILTWSWLRLAGATLILVALVVQLTASISAALANPTPHGGHLPTVLTNFFSYFTILSNVSAAIALLVAGGWGLRHASDAVIEPPPIARLRACVATYMITTGVVYNLLLRNAQVGISAPWVNEVLHVAAPLLLLADAFFAPARRRKLFDQVGDIGRVDRVQQRVQRRPVIGIDGLADRVKVLLAQLEPILGRGLGLGFARLGHGWAPVGRRRRKGEVFRATISAARPVLNRR